MNDLQAALEPGPFPEPIRGDHHVIFYDDPTTLTEDQIDPLLWPIVQQINTSGWVWTAEACQGHPDDTSPSGPWANNHRAMLRLVCRRADLGRMLDLICQAVLPNFEADEFSQLPWETWVGFRPDNEAPRYAEATTYIGAHGPAVGGRDRSIRAWQRFADLAALHPVSGPEPRPADDDWDPRVDSGGRHSDHPDFGRMLPRLRSRQSRHIGTNVAPIAPLPSVSSARRPARRCPRPSPSSRSQ